MSKSKQHDRNRRAIQAPRGKGNKHPMAAITKAHQEYNRDRVWVYSVAGAKLNPDHALSLDEFMYRNAPPATE